MARIIDGSAMNLVGKKIKKLRKQRKMTQRELSEKLELLGVYVWLGFTHGRKNTHGYRY